MDILKTVEKPLLCHSESFGGCHSERSEESPSPQDKLREESQLFAQDKLRETSRSATGNKTLRFTQGDKSEGFRETMSDFFNNLILQKKKRNEENAGYLGGQRTTQISGAFAARPARRGYFTGDGRILRITIIFLADGPSPPREGSGGSA